MKESILVVDDEVAITTLITYNLEVAGFKTDIAHDGEEALHKINKGAYDLVVLDIMLPKISGIEVCQRIREKENQIPVLMVTAKTELEDIIEGLNTGADDYITKPFSPKELIARVHAILRRAQSTTTEERLVVGEIEVVPNRYEAYFKKELLTLTKKEFELLAYLVKNKGLILSREQLLEAVWDFDFAGDTRIVDVHIAKLRNKLEKDTKQPKYIKTVFGFGYKLEEI